MSSINDDCLEAGLPWVLSSGTKVCLCHSSVIQSNVVTYFVRINSKAQGVSNNWFPEENFVMQAYALRYLPGNLSEFWLFPCTLQVSDLVSKLKFSSLQSSLKIKRHQVQRLSLLSQKRFSTFSSGLSSLSAFEVSVSALDFCSWLHSSSQSQHHNFVLQ